MKSMGSNIEGVNILASDS